MSSISQVQTQHANFPEWDPRLLRRKHQTLNQNCQTLITDSQTLIWDPQTFQAVCQTFGNNCQTFLSNFSYSCRFHTANIWDPEKFGVEIKVWEESLTIVSKSLGAWDQSLGAWDQSLGSLTQSLTILIQSLMFSPQKFGVSPPESLMLSLNLKDDCSFYFGSTLACSYPLIMFSR